MCKEGLNANIALVSREDLIICGVQYQKPSGTNLLWAARDICMQIHAGMNMHICIHEYSYAHAHVCKISFNIRGV